VGCNRLWGGGVEIEGHGGSNPPCPGGKVPPTVVDVRLGATMLNSTVYRPALRAIVWWCNDPGLGRPRWRLLIVLFEGP